MYHRPESSSRAIARRRNPFLWPHVPKQADPMVCRRRFFDKLLQLENVKLFSRQDKILYILDTIILKLYRKLYLNIVSIIVLNVEARQYNIKINLAISCTV